MTSVNSLRRFGALVVLVLVTAAGCSGETPGPAPAASAPAAPAGGGPVTVTVGDRPFTLHIPSGYQKGTAAPLLILLHGYTSSGDEQERYLKFAPEADKRGVLYATPDGSQGARGNRFWNATDACCNFSGSTVDDGAYILDVIKAVSATYPVDTKRVYLVGHSNGAFMSYRMACDHADAIAGIAALNGATWSDPARCKPSRPLSVLHIRGTKDQTILNEGGRITGNAYPSTAATVAAWAGLNGCATSADTSAAPVDLESSVAGAETTVSRYPDCQGGSKVELWTIADGGHIPAFTDAFAPGVFDFLLAQTLT